MKTFIHVLYIWLLANLILSIIWLPMDVLTPPYGIEVNVFTPQIFLFAILLLTISLPSLLLSLVFFNAITVLKYSVIEKLFLWYLTTVFTVILNISLPPLIIAGIILFASPEELLLLDLPAIASVILSVTIRYKYFINLNKVYKQQIINQ